VADLLFGVDVVCFVFFVLVESWKLLREIANGARKK
jgi:hypothetical protein